MYRLIIFSGRPAPRDDKRTACSCISCMSERATVCVCVCVCNINTSDVESLSKEKIHEDTEKPISMYRRRRLLEGESSDGEKLQIFESQSTYIIYNLFTFSGTRSRSLKPIPRVYLYYTMEGMPPPPQPLPRLTRPPHSIVHRLYTYFIILYNNQRSEFCYDAISVAATARINSISPSDERLRVRSGRYRIRFVSHTLIDQF